MSKGGRGLPEAPRSLGVLASGDSLVVRIPGSRFGRAFVGVLLALLGSTCLIGAATGRNLLIGVLWSVLPAAGLLVALPTALPSTLRVGPDGVQVHQWSVGRARPSELRFPWTLVRAVVVRPHRSGQGEHEPDEPGHVEIHFEPRTLPSPLRIASGRPDVELVWLGILLEAFHRDLRDRA